MVNRENSANLDALRSIAVLLVFFSHVFITLGVGQILGLPVSEFGRSGVLLFFVHTSLVLMMSMQRMGLGAGWRDSAVFYIRRFFRIYPLSIVCILVMLLFRVPAEPIVPFHMPTAGGAAANLLLVMNISEHKPILGPLWSLPYEVQMYLVLPLLYLFVRRHQSIRRLLVLMAISAAGALVERAVMGRSSILQFGPCFISGVLSYQCILKQRREPTLPSFTWPMTVFALATFYVVLVKLSHTRSDVPPGWAMCLTLGFLIPLWREIASPAFGRVVKEIAKYSYGIYLFHNPIIWLSLVVLGSWPAPLRWSVLVAGMIVVPFAAFHLVESPMIDRGKDIARLLVSRPRARAAAASAPAVSSSELG